MKYRIKVAPKAPKPFQHPDKFGWGDPHAGDFLMHPVQGSSVHPGAKKFNPNHAPAGGPDGGQFTSGDGGSGGASVLFEVSPDPNNKALTGRWQKLSDEEKTAISQKVAEQITPDVLKALDAKGQLEQLVGGYLGATNPSLALETDAAHAIPAAKLLGYSLSQDSMMISSADAASGLNPTGAVVVHVPEGMDLAGYTKMYDNLYKIADSKGPLLTGFTGYHDHMVIANFPEEDGSFRVSTDKLAELVDKQLGGQYSVHADTIHTAFVSHEDYLNASDSETQGLQGVWGQSASRLRSEATQALEKELGKRGKAGFAFRAGNLRFRFNPNHVPAGSPDGGQFASGDSSGGSSLPGVLTVHSRNGIKGEVTQNSSLASHIVLHPDGSYGLDPEREALHQQIVNKFLDGAVKPTGQPELLMTGGGPAAGKSTILNEGLVSEPANAVSINPDDIKAEIPEYAGMVANHDANAGTYVHEESSMISKELQAAAISNGYNVVLDTTGDTGVDNLSNKLQPFKDAGYKINAVYATTDIDTAIARNVARFEKTGRLVPEWYVRESHALVSGTFPGAVSAGLFNHASLYDTTTNKGELVASADGTRLTVQDQGAYDAFLKKAYAVKDTNGRVDTDTMAQMIVAIMAGVHKPNNLSPRESTAWDTLAEQCKNAPKGAIIDPGDELPSTDLSHLYSSNGPMRKKFATTAGAINVENTQWVPIKKTNDEKQIVYGEVYAPWVLDTYGEFMTPEDIELMAHRFMQLDLGKVIDTQHDNKPNGSRPVESFIARDGDPDYTPGSWVLGVHIPDASLWDAVKKGMLNGFSFQSLVKPTPVAVDINAIRDFVGDTELSEDHSHSFYVELDDIGNVVGGRTSKAADGHYHEIQWASVTNRTDGHSHRFFL